MTWLKPMRAYTPDEQDPRGRDQQPETDACPDWPYFRHRVGPNHLKHAGHHDREARP